MRARYFNSTLASVLNLVVWASLPCALTRAESIVTSTPQTEGERRLLEWDTTRKFVPLKSTFFSSSAKEYRQAQVSQFATRSFGGESSATAKRFSTPEFLNDTARAAKNTVTNTVSSVSSSPLFKRLFPSIDSETNGTRLLELPAVAEAKRLAGDASRSALSASSAIVDRTFTSPEFLANTAQAAKNTFTTTAAAVSSSTVFKKPFNSGNPAVDTKPFSDISSATEAGRMASESYRTYLGPEVEKMKQKYTPETGPRGGVITGHPLTVEELREILNRNK